MSSKLLMLSHKLNPTFQYINNDNQKITEEKIKTLGKLLFEL